MTVEEGIGVALALYGVVLVLFTMWLLAAVTTDAVRCVRRWLDGRRPTRVVNTEGMAATTLTRNGDRWVYDLDRADAVRMTPRQRADLETGLRLLQASLMPDYLFDLLGDRDSVDSMMERVELVGQLDEIQSLPERER